MSYLQVLFFNFYEFTEVDRSKFINSHTKDLTTVKQKKIYINSICIFKKGSQIAYFWIFTSNDSIVQQSKNPLVQPLYRAIQRFK